MANKTGFTDMIAPPTQPTASKLLLPKSVYGLETDPKNTPFGMVNGQVRTDSVLNNAGWFNLMGEKIGHGDMSMKDMQKIANGLNASECFFVLTEFDTIWNMPKDMNANEPGKDYVLKHCAWSVSRSSILKVRDTTTIVKNENAKSSDGIEYTKVGRAAFEKVINVLFFAPKAVATKHTLPPGTKTDGIDAVVKANLNQLQKILAQKPVQVAGGIAPAVATPRSTGTVAVNPPAKPSPVLIPTSTPYPKTPTTTPIKVKRITP